MGKTRPQLRERCGPLSLALSALWGDIPIWWRKMSFQYLIRWNNFSPFLEILLCKYFRYYFPNERKQSRQLPSAWRKQSNFQAIYPWQVGNDSFSFQRKWENCCVFQKWFPDTSLWEHSQQNACKQALKTSVSLQGAIQLHDMINRQDWCFTHSQLWASTRACKGKLTWILLVGYRGW